MSRPVDILLSELFVFEYSNTRHLHLIIEKAWFVDKIVPVRHPETRGEVMFPLQVEIIIKTNNQIKFDSQQIHQPHLFRVRHDP